MVRTAALPQSRLATSRLQDQLPPAIGAQIKDDRPSRRDAEPNAFTFRREDSGTFKMVWGPDNRLCVGYASNLCLVPR